MSVLLMSLVWGSTIKDRTQVDILNYLANCADDCGGNCFPGLERIAKYTRCSVRTVSRTIAELSREGWLEVVEAGNGAGNRTEFLIQVEKLKGCQDVTLSLTGKRVTIRQKRVTPATKKVDIDATPPHPLIGRPIIETSGDPSSSSPAAQSKRTKGVKSVDLRHTPFREILGAYWKSKNPTIEMPWGPAEAGALGQVLSASPDLTAEQFRQLLHNRWKSEVNHSDRPSRWLHNVLSYAGGAVDRFGNLLSTNGGNKNGQYRSRSERTVDNIQQALQNIAARHGIGLDGAPAGSRADGEDAGVICGEVVRPTEPTGR